METVHKLLNIYKKTILYAILKCFFLNEKILFVFKLLVTIDDEYNSQSILIYLKFKIITYRRKFC